ncbi:MAG: RNA-binding protein [Thermoplasmata archaeon]|nr:RNA-binding protein [Thermoplasmata archaeon]NIT77185.1 RNA-binding protein [Thermoplasmata archaeon]NIU49100.1 RNA-binding protein [Thermoplasmata archaeon]NIV78754.1 RNA-binding protein [Thermoplasmata archaeon]NIW82584.1 RNA-binding protein [Thermoplasmata archaeon]
MPISALDKAMNRKVQLLLKDRRVLAGNLRGYDEHMNLVLDDTEETDTEGNRRKIGTIVLRGSNVVSISRD